MPVTDPLTPERRSKLMARIGPKNTKPELIVRRMLYAAGWRYRIHGGGLPGTPDIVFGSRRVALFVHGCFWHGHHCRLGRLPKTRPEFWSTKIAGNRARDARKVDQLVERGWRVMTIWQCDLQDEGGALDDIEAFLNGGGTTAESRLVKNQKGS
ncbi:very short patch repair endonuclease [Mesorhizobium sp. B2-3-12]|uniref:very short patch repair endonuclease n=1 Tax=Mesorhizobium sp. B2-3-12 TaxID=2589952 RepID=UPI0011280972|nr:very short patch repair endonuclease [Mesorhizobium sp. B2-3-12]TPL93816.1 DNA mismatch endonuclease Vsr [Mesorhizobium sp. B2-3-12]